MIVEWITEWIRYMREKNFIRIATPPQAEEQWGQHMDECARRTILYDTTSWFMGQNIPGKKRALLLHAGNAPTYRREVRMWQPRETKGVWCSSRL
jgi:hypothetical protein